MSRASRQGVYARLGRAMARPGTQGLRSSARVALGPGSALADARLSGTRGLSLGSAQRLPDLQKILPDLPLRQRLPQQIGRVQGRDRFDLARAGVEREPAPARAHDAFG